MLKKKIPNTFQTFISLKFLQLKKETNFLKIIPALIFGAVFFIGAASNISAQILFVDRLDDADVSACSDAPNDCTLRGAINKANSTPASSAAILFDSRVFIPGSSIVLSGGELSITTNVNLTINSISEIKITIDGNNQFRPFKIGTQSNVIFNNLIIKGGKSFDLPIRGGGIWNAGNLTINRSVIENNVSIQHGGGVYNEGNLTISDSTFRNNSALTSGGGIYNTGGIVNIGHSTINYNLSGSTGGSGGGVANNSGTIGIINSTIFGNEGNNGGGIGNFGTLILNSSTVSNNRTNPFFGVGGGVLNSGQFESRNSIIARNIAPNAPDFQGILSSLGYNLIQNTTLTTITGNTAGNILDQDPLFDQNGLQNNGGETLTIALSPNSPAIDAADPNNFPPIDQRRRTRPADGDNNGSLLPDIGAFELSRILIVTKTADTNDGVCDSDCSLREAITVANSTSTDEIITFDPAVFSSPQTIILSGTELVIQNNGTLTINGAGMNVLTISGNEASRVINILFNSNVIINNLSIKNGSVTTTSGEGIWGGGILNAGALILNDVNISNCFSLRDGGGLFSADNFQTTINNSVIENNTGNLGTGGGIYVRRGTISINNSLIKNNQAKIGGGIDNLASVSMTNSVVDNNYASDSGGGIRNNASFNLSKSSIINNTSVNEGGGLRGDRFTISNSIISGNSSAVGGGIMSVSLTLINSTIDGNYAGFGGGIYIFGSGSKSIVSSTISNNISSDGAGGVSNFTGILNLINSTISGNSAVQDGGGINNRGILNLTNSTIARNSSASGGGIINLGGTVNARNSIIAANSLEDFFGTITSGGYNLIGNTQSTTIVGTNLETNIIGADPQLLPLRNYGGLTKTHALRPTSPAIDKALLTDILSTTADQRGRIRPYDFPTIPNAPNGDGSDIGAFERQANDVNGISLFDFDGDGKTDIAVFRPSVGEWWYRKSGSGQVSAAQFGQATDIITPADFTGDRKTDIAVFRPNSGEWFVLRSDDSSFYSFPFGISGDIPLAADFDGDGKADPVIFRPSNSTWYILNSSGETTITAFGASGDIPQVGDFDGDGKADLAVFRPSTGEWWINRSATQTVIVYNFGTASDKPVPADYTGDGRADVAFWRPSTGEWFILRSENNSFYSFPFGTSGDIPAAGDYDGDGRSDAAVFRPSNGTWYLLQSTSGFSALGFGSTGDLPVPSAFIQ